MYESSFDRQLPEIMLGYDPSASDEDIPHGQEMDEDEYMELQN